MFLCLIQNIPGSDNYHLISCKHPVVERELLVSMQAGHDNNFIMYYVLG